MAPRGGARPGAGRPSKADKPENPRFDVSRYSDVNVNELALVLYRFGWRLNRECCVCFRATVRIGRHGIPICRKCGRAAIKDLRGSHE
jgi:uncharacterized UBP type Zn finger protein